MSSTFAAEARGLSNGLGRLEWCAVMLAEAILQDEFDLVNRTRMLAKIPMSACTDCKSVYDKVVSPGQKTLEDQRAALDILIIKDALARCSVRLRWAPTDLQLADCLTKDSAGPSDRLRAAMRASRYAISLEADVLHRAAEERRKRLDRGTERRLANSLGGWNKEKSSEKEVTCDLHGE